MVEEKEKMALEHFLLEIQEHKHLEKLILYQLKIALLHQIMY